MDVQELRTRTFEAEAESQGEHRCEDTAPVHVYNQRGEKIGEASDAYALHGVFVVEVR